jgi:hypothetical protein
MTYAVPYDVIERLEQAARDCRANKRIAIGAIFGGGLTQSSHRSAMPLPTLMPALMPAWLATTIVVLDRGIADANARDFLHDLASSARQWQLLDDAAWQRVFVFFSAACMEIARDIAEPLQSAATSAYWAEACDACEQVLAALRGEIDMAQAGRSAATAAWAWESESASVDPPKRAAPADTTWAIKCVCDTADDVARAALGDASLIAEAADRAAATAGYAICTTSQEPHWLLGRRLFSLINAEIAAAQGWRPALSFSR